MTVIPDSFSDGGRWNNLEKAKQHVADMIEEGAGIIDVGGESTRPGHVQITIQEEIERVVPVIEMIKKNFDIPVSIDSYKSQVVEAALKAGAEEMCEDLRESVAIAKAANIPDEHIILDPGVGFGKTYEQNLIAIHQLEKLKEIGYPVLLATSRKSVIGLTLDLPSDERVEGTMVTTVMGVEKGAAFVRVHDVKENLRAIRMTQAILRECKA